MPAVALVWMGLLGVGLAFALAAIGTLVVENSAASETGVASGVNLIMRTVGAAIGAQVAAAVISAQTPAGGLIPHEPGFTIAFALAAGAASLALVPALAAGSPRAAPAAAPARAQPRLNVPIRRPRAIASGLIAARTSSGFAPCGSFSGAAQRIELEDVAVRRVALRRARAAVAVVAERVLALLAPAVAPCPRRTRRVAGGIA